jgi:UPF0755 protein
LGFIASIIKAIVGVAMILAVVAAGVVIFLNLNLNIDLGGGSKAEKPQGEMVMFKIEPGQTADEIATNLEKEDLIDNTFWFKTRLKLSDGVTLKAGLHQLTRGMSTDDLIEVLSTSPVEKGLTFQVIEGMRLEEIADKLSSDGIVDRANFLRLATTPEGIATFQNNFLSISGKPAELSLEGYLFPDTYEIKNSGGDNSETVIRTMLTTMEAKFTPEMQKAMADQELSVHHVLTIASIVEREGQVPEELRKISSVYWNRVRAGMPLDADPTTQYAVAKEGDWWPDLDALYRAGTRPVDVEHPYNTYAFAGLPPGPICNPGLASLEAAVFPEETDYLFFVAKMDGTGEHLFATTNEEHERNRVQVGNR